MIDALGKYDFWNNTPTTYTQTGYLRFLNSPENMLNTLYWNEENENRLRTYYTPFLERFL